jgi:hypothetical protein
VKHRDLLAAISDLDPIGVRGTFERHTSLRWEELKASAAGGRWGASRAFEVLYLGRPPDSVVIEAYRHLVDDELDDAQALAASVLERRIVTCEVDVPNPGCACGSRAGIWPICRRPYGQVTISEKAVSVRPMPTS